MQLSSKAVEHPVNMLKCPCKCSLDSSPPPLFIFVTDIEFYAHKYKQMIPNLLYLIS